VSPVCIKQFWKDIFVLMYSNWILRSLQNHSNNHVMLFWIVPSIWIE
jgi:hypothetical protein